MQNEVKIIYKKIQKALISLIPENWKSIYLYASVINETGGEMYYYYFPKKIIKTRPINCYEVPDRFGINEDSYNNSLAKLYEYIKDLSRLSRPKWTNLTIVIENNIFTVEYHYNELIQSKYNDEQRRIVWLYKYLKTPIESLSQENRILIDSYKEETRIQPRIYTEKMETDDNNEEDSESNNTSYKLSYTPNKIDKDLKYSNKTDIIDNSNNDRTENNIIRNPFLKF